MLRTATHSTMLAAALLASGTLGTLTRPASAADPCRKCGSPNCQQTANHAPANHAAVNHAVAEPRPLVVGNGSTTDATPTASNTAALAGVGHVPAGHVHGGVPAGYAAGYPTGYPTGYPAGYPGMGAGPLASAVASHYAPNCRPQMYGQPDLFAQYYLPPTCGGVGAEIYPAPYAVPPHVGHVYYTYQPLAPHELLYPHHRTYHRYYNGGRGLTRTRVHWYNPPLRTAGESILEHFRIAR